MALEFGVVAEERRRPVTAMVTSGLLFVVGSLPSILPFVFVSDTLLGLWIAAAAAGIGVFSVGAVKTYVTHGSLWWSGFENTAIATFGAALSYGVGRLFDAAV
jgi:VIT1/CCC1 family predicted Fe2+/Mn2+ transporter